MTILQDFLKDLAELVNIDAGTRNAAGVTKAAEIMKRHYESIGFHAELVDLSPDCGKALLATNLNIIDELSDGTTFMFACTFEAIKTRPYPVKWAE